MSTRLHPLRLAALLAGCVGLLTLLTIAFVDGPDPSHGFRHVVSVHDSLIPTHTWADPSSPDRPRLEGQAEVQETDLAFSTWMVRWRGRWASVHRIDRVLALPPQARVVEPRQPERSTFDVGDLALLAWEDEAHTWVIAGSGDAVSLLALSEVVLNEGVEAFSRPNPARPPAGAPGAAPAPR